MSNCFPRNPAIIGKFFDQPKLDYLGACPPPRACMNAGKLPVGPRVRPTAIVVLTLEMHSTTDFQSVEAGRFAQSRSHPSLPSYCRREPVGQVFNLPSALRGAGFQPAPLPAPRAPKAQLLLHTRTTCGAVFGPPGRLKTCPTCSSWGRFSTCPLPASRGPEARLLLHTCTT